MEELIIIKGIFNILNNSKCYYYYLLLY